MTASPRTLAACLLPALLLTACAHKQAPEPVLSVRPVVSKCPTMDIPPELLTRPAIVDFLSKSD